MRAQLIFFDTRRESANGTLRGLIAFVAILVLYAAAHAAAPGLFDLDYRIVVTALLLCSCLGVFELQSAKSAAVLGALVSFVLFSVALLHGAAPRAGVAYVSVGTLIGVAANLLVWRLYWRGGARAAQ